MALRYPIWLSTTFKRLIKVENYEQRLKFNLFGVCLLQLEYVYERSDINRQLFYITGGFLTKRKDLGWLEFRSILGGAYIITAIHEFVPRQICTGPKAQRHIRKMVAQMCQRVNPLWRSFDLPRGLEVSRRQQNTFAMDVGDYWRLFRIIP